MQLQFNQILKSGDYLMKNGEPLLKKFVREDSNDEQANNISTKYLKPLVNDKKLVISWVYIKIS